ncbi:GtrA family protein [Cohnella sp. GCM10020058]|uniref:GtrA family protein n=1 Tax=Cohnella sp. GCM10020058 TaxID=3317330 RepID=UPI00363E50BC
MKQLLRTRFIKYGLVGLLGTIVHFAILIILVEHFNIKPVPASAIGFVVVLLISFELNRKFTFKEAKRASNLYTFAKYTITSVAGLALNSGIMYASVNLLSQSYLFGQVCVTIVIPVFNYFLNRSWTFRSPMEGR